MWWIVGILVFAELILYCSCVAASDADDAEEKWWKEHGEALVKNNEVNNGN